MARYDAPSRRSGGQKQNTFFGGAAILAAGILVVKLIGMFYKIPLVNIIGDQGSTDFTNAYNIYSVLLTISTAGLPVAVSKLVSARMAKGKVNSAGRIFRCTLLFALVSGGIGSLLIYFGAGFFSDVLVSTPQSRLALQVLAPTILMVALMGCMRGYFQGLGSMVPTAVSQIVEQIVNAAVSIGALRRMVSVSWVEKSASLGSTWDSAGISSTSSKVRPSFENFIW